jgi:hypothetical protein
MGDRTVAARLPVSLIASIEKWADRNDLSRSQAIRRLVENSLLTSTPPGRRSQSDTAKASRMAGSEIERMADKSATAEERAKRKRRLIEGPREFRDRRKD